MYDPNDKFDLLSVDYDDLSLADRCEAMRLAREDAIQRDPIHLADCLPVDDPRRAAYDAERKRQGNRK